MAILVLKHQFECINATTPPLHPHHTSSHTTPPPTNMIESIQQTSVLHHHWGNLLVVQLQSCKDDIINDNLEVTGIYRVKQHT